jgi:ABC-type antimicrobial peptide transport system permease subunit
MYTNINEQTKEIGILRAIGARRFFVWRLYIYEAFVLLIAASILGLCIGLIVGYTMTLQQILFTQYKLTFWFPWQPLLVVIGLSIVFAFISAALPIIQLTYLPIVTIMKRLVT